ncbi:MAG TPA: 4-hydroxy-tetrahydrodipicolinate reductase [Bacteroidales bacterium]|nr:4-hydroxy-tetrahydrodipicolinate reductase [Bacteroidales bacterium]
MNIALIGYGRMGHEVETIALKRGHNIGLIIDKDNTSDLNKLNLKGIDTAIEFSLPSTAFHNISECLNCGIPVLSGTTGWLDDYERAADLCRKNNTSFIHATNFSLGVNLFFRLSSELARSMKKYSDYSVSIEEIHHTRKLDSPSGTAITLAEGIAGEHNGYKGWHKGSSQQAGSIPIISIREGDVPGTHSVNWDCEIDSLSFRHEAKNRKGLALGAVVAAEFISTRKGVFTMNDVMGF